MRDDQGIWNFIFAVFYISQLIFAVWILFRFNRLPTEIGLFDLSLIVLATFRLTRLFVYDGITQFIRDWFLDKKVLAGTDGELVVVRSKPLSGFRRTASELLSCPWCFGLWAALLVTLFFPITPFAWFIVLILAVAGTATFIQIFISMIGWRIEHLKRLSGGD